MVTVEEAFSGFSSLAVITVWVIYIINASLTFTGIADFIGNQISRIRGIQQEALRDDISFLFLQPPTKSGRRLNKAPLNLIIFIGRIASVATGVLHNQWQPERLPSYLSLRTV